MKKFLKCLVNGKPATDQQKYHVLLGLFAVTLFTLLLTMAGTDYSLVL